MTRFVPVPPSLLLDPNLPASAKLVWMLCHLRAQPGRVGPALLQTLAGLSRPTVLKGLANLKATGWDPATDHPSKDTRVSVPGALLRDRRVGAQGRVLYGILTLVPGLRTQSGQFTYAELGALARISTNTAKRGVSELVAAGWLQVAQESRLAPIRFAFRDPEVARGEAEVAEARQRIEEAPYRGEAIMRECLSLLIDSDDFEDDAAPGFLINPLTDERMQLDRYYPRPSRLSLTESSTTDLPAGLPGWMSPGNRAGI